jgi:hypothetical protein
MAAADDDDDDDYYDYDYAFYYNKLFVSKYFYCQEILQIIK